MIYVSRYYKIAYILGHILFAVVYPHTNREVSAFRKQRLTIGVGVNMGGDNEISDIFGHFAYGIKISYNEV